MFNLVILVGLQLCIFIFIFLCIFVFMFRMHRIIFIVEVSCILGMAMVFVEIPERLKEVFSNLTIFISPFGFNF